MLSGLTGRYKRRLDLNNPKDHPVCVLTSLPKRLRSGVKDCKVWMKKNFNLTRKPSSYPIDVLQENKPPFKQQKTSSEENKHELWTYV